MTVALTAPVVAMAEAKNENLHTGLGQCIAAMVAAQEFNRKSNSPINTIYGVVTTGSLWTFLRLNGRELVYDPREYYINEIGSIMAILMHILQGNAE